MQSHVIPCKTYLMRAANQRIASKQVIALMIDSGTQIRPINLDRLLIEHNIIMGVEHIVVVPASLCQEVCDHKGGHAGLLTHGKHGLPLMCLTKYSTCIPLIAAFVEYQTLAKNDEIEDELIFAKADAAT